MTEIKESAALIELDKPILPDHHRELDIESHELLFHRRSGAMRSIEPGISRFPDAQLRI
jgi:hypothetical protein